MLHGEKEVVAEHLAGLRRVEAQQQARPEALLEEGSKALQQCRTALHAVCVRLAEGQQHAPHARAQLRVEQNALERALDLGALLRLHVFAHGDQHAPHAHQQAEPEQHLVGGLARADLANDGRHGGLEGGREGAA